MALAADAGGTWLRFAARKSRIIPRDSLDSYALSRQWSIFGPFLHAKHLLSPIYGMPGSRSLRNAVP